MRKMLRVLTLSAILIVAFAFTALAEWKQDANEWWWDNGNGTYPKSQWQWCDGNGDGIAECYYFDANGYCLRNTTTPDGYTVNADGAWVKDGKIQTKSTGIAITEDTIDESKLAGKYTLYAIELSDGKVYRTDIFGYSGYITLNKDGTARWKDKNAKLITSDWYYDMGIVTLEKNGSSVDFEYNDGVLVCRISNGAYYYVKSGADTSWIGAITKQQWMDSLYKK